MKSANYKYQRLAEDIKRVLSETINEDIERYIWVTITEVELTKDLGDVKIYFETLEENRAESAKKELEKSEKYFKKIIGREVTIRRVPNLLFYIDTRLDNYNHIENLIKKVEKED